MNNTTLAENTAILKSVNGVFWQLYNIERQLQSKHQNFG